MLSKKKKIIIGCAAVVALILVGAALAVEQYYRLEVCNFISKDGNSHGYYVYPGMTADSVISLMAVDYDIASMADWRIHKRRLLFTSPKPGYYSFPARVGDKHLIRRYQLGEESPIRITWNNQIRTREQLAGRLGTILLADSAEIICRLDSTEYMSRYGFNRDNALCLFIPNTYEVYWTITPDHLFERMNKEYNRFWNESRRHKADSIGLSPTEVAVLASIVESETHNAKEHPAIASLYLNRIHKGMHLQACPTVIYATGNLKMRRVLKRHLSIDSPYNTYKYVGLPPGPIRCAKGSTIDIVLNAPKTSYLFMCANPDFSGTHIFSERFGQHAGTAKQYQRALDKRLKEQEQKRREETVISQEEHS